MQRSIANVVASSPLTILYLRLSSEEQAKGDGLERQLAAVTGWCRREGREPDILLEDIGLSAFDGAHISKGHMGALIAAVQDGRVRNGSIVVTENLDRLSRDNPLEAISILLGMLKKGVDVVTATDGARYTSSGTGNQSMMMLVMSALHFGRSNSESETKSDRVSKAWRKKINLARTALKPHGKRCPAWIRLGPAGYELIDERVQEVRRMFASTIAGMGRRQIVKDLVARKVVPWGKPTRRRPVPVWSDSYIQKILTGCEAYGTYQPSLAPKRGVRTLLDPIPGFYPAAVSEQTAAMARSAASLRRGSGGRKGAFLNLFQGLCVCGVCGRGMTLENKGRRSSGPKLVCQRASLADCAHTFRYAYEWLEPAIVFIVENRAESLAHAARERGDALVATIDAHKTALADMTTRLDRLARQMERIDDEDGTLAKNFVALRDERRALLQELAGLEAQAASSRPVADGKGLPALIEFYRRLAEVPLDRRPAARNAVNQSLRGIIQRISFDRGLVSVEFEDGGKGIVKARSPMARRDNAGHFVAGWDASGKQLRRGSRRIATGAVEIKQGRGSARAERE